MQYAKCNMRGYAGMCYMQKWRFERHRIPAPITMIFLVRTYNREDYHLKNYRFILPSRLKSSTPESGYPTRAAVSNTDRFGVRVP